MGNSALRNMLERAIADPVLARNLLSQPVTVLAQYGTPLPGLSNEKFSSFLATNAPRLHSTMTASAKGLDGGGWTSADCLLCETLCAAAMALLISGTFAIAPEVDLTAALSEWIAARSVFSPATVSAVAKALYDAYRAGASTVAGATCGANEIGICPPLTGGPGAPD